MQALFKNWIWSKPKTLFILQILEKKSMFKIKSNTIRFLLPIERKDTCFN